MTMCPSHVNKRRRRLLGGGASDKELVTSATIVESLTLAWVRKTFPTFTLFSSPTWLLVFSPIGLIPLNWEHILTGTPESDGHGDN